MAKSKTRKKEEIRRLRKKASKLKGLGYHALSNSILVEVKELKREVCNGQQN